MSFRSYSTSDGNESDYHGENMEYRKKMNKIKSYQSRKKDSYLKKDTKTYGGNSDTNHERNIRSGNDYSNSKNFSRKSGQHYQRNYLNKGNKSKYRDSDYDTKYRGRKDFDNKYSNSEKQQRKSKGKIDKINVYRKPSNPEGYIKKSKINGNNYSSKKYSKGKNLGKYSHVDYNSDREKGEEGEYYNSKDYNMYPKEKYAPSSEMGYESGEISESDEEISKPKSLREREKNIRIVTRSMWDSEPGNPDADRLPRQPFNHINYVDTSSPICYNQKECIEVLRSIKKRDQSIKHNFYIGGDSLIYEGKGWVADTNEEAGFKKRALGVAFIGTYSALRPPPPMLITAYHLVNSGIVAGKILKSFSHDFLMCQPVME